MLKLYILHTYFKKIICIFHYKIRCAYPDTFASHCIDSGMTIQETADITGHDIKVLYKHYLGSVKKPKLPEL